MVRSIDTDRQNVSIPEVKMTRAEQLESACDGSPEDERLRQLILAVLMTEPDSFARKRAMNRLLRYAQNSPRIRRDSHPYYLEALDNTWEWLGRHIDKFDPTRTSGSLNDRFFRWVNYTANKRLLDLKVQTSKEISIDRTFKNPEGDTFTLELPSPEPYSIEKIIDRELGNIFQAKLEEFLIKDSDHRLVNCCMKQHPRCNCHVLVLRLVIDIPPAKKTDVAQELGVPYQGMYAHWTRNCLKLLREISHEIAQDVGYEMPQFLQ